MPRPAGCLLQGPGLYAAPSQGETKNISDAENMSVQSNKNYFFRRTRLKSLIFVRSMKNMAFSVSLVFKLSQWKESLYIVHVFLVSFVPTRKC